MSNRRRLEFNYYSPQIKYRAFFRSAKVWWEFIGTTYIYIDNIISVAVAKPYGMNLWGVKIETQSENYWLGRGNSQEQAIELAHNILLAIDKELDYSVIKEYIKSIP